jgi:hypothetical protein
MRLTDDCCCMPACTPVCLVCQAADRVHPLHNPPRVRDGQRDATAGGREPTSCPRCVVLSFFPSCFTRPHTHTPHTHTPHTRMSDDNVMARTYTCLARCYNTDQAKMFQSQTCQHAWTAFLCGTAFKKCSYADGTPRPPAHTLLTFVFFCRRRCCCCCC